MLQLQLRLVLCATGSSSVAVTTLGKWKGRGHVATGVGTLVICKYFNGTSQKTPKEQGERNRRVEQPDGHAEAMMAMAMADDTNGPRLTS